MVVDEMVDVWWDDVWWDDVWWDDGWSYFMWFDDLIWFGRCGGGKITKWNKIFYW